MVPKYPLLGLFGLLACFVTGIVADEALIFGQVAEENQFPYHVAVIVNGFNHVCGGSIIDAEHILTAAHCVITNKNLFFGNHLSILFRANHLWQPRELGFIIEVIKIYVPKEYSPPLERSTGDIAVLKLRYPLDLKNLKHLKKLKLPKKNETYDGEIATIAGFGWNWIREEGTNIFGNNSDGYLRYTKTDITSNDQCKQEHPLLTISDKYICAQSKQLEVHRPVGVCTGDSGSPLVVDDSIVVGVLSFGPAACKEIISSAIYTRVSHFLTFINNAIKDRRTRNIRTYDLIL